MANLLVMDDEPFSLRRLFKVLYEVRQHKLWTAENLVSGVEIVAELSGTLDLVIVDVSMFQTAAGELLELFAGACPTAKMLVLGPTLKQPLSKPHPILRKPFSDGEFTQAVDAVLAMRQGVAVRCEGKRKLLMHSSSCSDRRPVRVRAAR